MSLYMPPLNVSTAQLLPAQQNSPQTLPEYKIVLKEEDLSLVVLMQVLPKTEVTAEKLYATSDPRAGVSWAKHQQKQQQSQNTVFKTTSAKSANKQVTGIYIALTHNSLLFHSSTQLDGMKNTGLTRITDLQRIESQKNSCGSSTSGPTAKTTRQHSSKHGH